MRFKNLFLANTGNTGIKSSTGCHNEFSPIAGQKKSLIEKFLKVLVHHRRFKGFGTDVGGCGKHVESEAMAGAEFEILMKSLGGLHLFIN